MTIFITVCLFITVCIVQKNATKVLKIQYILNRYYIFGGDRAANVGIQSELHREKTGFCICENKTQISFAVTAKLISAFVFAIYSTIPLLSKSEISSF